MSPTTLIFMTHSLHRAFSRLLAPALFGALLALPRPAWAGHWEVQQYLRDATIHSEEWLLTRDSMDPNAGAVTLAQGGSSFDSRVLYRLPEQNHLATLQRPDGLQNLVLDGSRESLGSPLRYLAGGNTVTVSFESPQSFLTTWAFASPTVTPVGTGDPRSGHAGGDLSLVAQLVWKANQTYDPQVGHAVDDPTDPPPADVYLVEEAQLTGSQQLPIDAPDDPTPIRFYGLECPLAADDAAFPVQSNQTLPDSVVTTFGNAGKRLVHCDNPDHDRVVYGPTRHFKGQIDLRSNYVIPAMLDKRGGAGLDFDYKAKPLQFQLAWKTGETPVAAGAKDTPVHQAKFTLTFKDNDGNVITNVPLDLPLALPKVATQIVSGGLGPTNTVTAKVTLDATATDSNGQITGLFTSGSRVETTTIGIPKKLDSGSFASLSTDQGWANVELKMGENGDKPWPTNFFSDGFTEWYWTKLTAPNNKPLVGHTLKVLVDHLVVEVGTPQGLRTEFFTRDAAEADQHRSDPDTDVFCQDDLSPLVGKYITPPAQGMSDNQGIFKGQFTVKKGDDFSIDSFGFYLQDQGVYSLVSPQ